MPPAAPATPNATMAALHTADWRHRVFALYAQVRELAADSPAAAHRHWRLERDALMAGHPASPLTARAKAAFTGLAVAPYDPAARMEAVIDAKGAGEVMQVQTGTDGVVRFVRLGTVHLKAFDGAPLAVWRLAGYGGGLFLPVRDALAGRPPAEGSTPAEGGTYGGGRYLLDTIKGAHLGEGRKPGTLLLDFNFAYNPSCAYDHAWACPLPGPDNRLDIPLPYGELAFGHHEL